MFSRIVKFVKALLFKYYSVFLILVVLISYGQILGMQPWEDDNALFFKLAHIQEPAGFWGAGPLGEGVYKYGVVPFIPIYKFFGFYTSAYFALLLVLYIVTTLVVYNVFRYVLGEKAGKLAGFLYAAGYIASEGFWRMTNSATTSMTIILISLFIKYYWKYYKERAGRYYFGALLIFFIAVQYSVVRNHYLFAIAVFFELIFFAFKKPLKSIFYSFVRLVPFVYIFYRYIILTGDTRIEGVKDIILSILNGKLYLTYGLFSSVANLIIPDYLINFIFNFQKQINVSLQTSSSLSWILLLVFSIITIFFLLKREKKKYILLPMFYLALLAWIKFSKNIYSIPVLSPGEIQLFTVTLGGIIILIFTAILVAFKKSRGLFLFLVLWLLTNIAAYSTYYPTVAYDTLYRYLAHSFFAYVGILGLLPFLIVKKGRFSKIMYWLIIVFGITNIYNAVVYQNNILKTRSFPVKNFYKDLSLVLTKIDKGDVLYFDISSNAQRYFRDAISTAMMPDKTSFAWRYGIDRYDLELVIDFDNLTDLVSTNKIGLEKIHSYWYSKDSLVDTSEDIRSYFQRSDNFFKSVSDLPKSSDTIFKILSSGSTWQHPEIAIDFDISMKSISPIEAVITITATPQGASGIQFPLWSESTPGKSEKFTINENQLALQYKQIMNNFIRSSIFEVSSNWQDRTMKNLYDENPDTVWQPDRVLWIDKKEYIKVKLPSPEIINRVYWLSGTYKDSIPTVYEMSTSEDGNIWRKVNIISSVDKDINHIVEFSPVYARYVKMQIKETLRDDSPMVAEFRVIPSRLQSLDVVKAESFLKNPFLFVSDQSGYYKTLQGLNYKGKLNIYWLGNKEEGWQATKETELEIIYDGRPHQYRFVLPAGGTLINKIKFSDITIPGKLILNGFTYRQYYK